MLPKALSFGEGSWGQPLGEGNVDKGDPLVSTRATLLLRVVYCGSTLNFPHKKGPTNDKKIRNQWTRITK